MDTQIRSNQFEDALIYFQGEERREVVLVHLPGEEPKVVLGQIPIGAGPEEGYFCELSLEEARAWLAFLQDLQQRGLL